MVANRNIRRIEAIACAIAIALIHRLYLDRAVGKAVQNDHTDRAGRRRAGQGRNLDRHAELERWLSEPDTVEKVYDNLDRSRALQAYLLALPIVNQAAMRDSLRQYGPVNTTDVIWENLVDSKTVELTANDNTVYSFIWVDTTQRAVGRRSTADGFGAD